MLYSMAVKIQSVTYYSRIPKWVHLRACICSSSCVSYVEEISESTRNPKDSSEFDQNMNSLRNKLVPESLVRVLEQTSDLKSAVKIFKWASLQKNFRHTTTTYYQIILKLGLAGNVLEMGAFCQNMVKERCRGAEESLVELIHTFVRHRRINEAMTVFDSMKLGGYKPLVDVYNILLAALVDENGEFQKVLFVYKEMVKAGIIPTVQTLNCLLEVLLATNRVELALDQFRRMNKKGCSPNSRTFEILVKGLIRMNRVDEAISVLDHMLDLKCNPELSFYTYVIPLFCRENMVEQGVRLFRMMKASDLMPDASTYGVLIQCFCNNLRSDSAICLANEMIESGISPHLNIFVDLVNCFCELGKINEAIMFLEDKHVLETAPYNALLEGCCSAGKIIEANVLLETMSERNIADCNSWNVLIRWLCENQGTRKAYNLIGRMITSSLIPDSATYSAFVIGNCRMGKYENAMQLFGQVCARSWVLDYASYSELVGGLCDIEKIEEAAEVFYYMTMKRCSLHPFSLYKLIKCFCDSGHIKKATTLRQLAFCSGTFCSIDTYTTIMHELPKSKGPKNLLVFFAQMLIEGCKLDLEAYCILIQSMGVHNRLKECVLLFNMMVDEGLIPDPDRLLDQLSLIASLSQLSMIVSSIDKLLCDSEILNSAMYRLLINGLWKEDKKDEARKLLDLMLEKGWLPDANTHKLLIGHNVRQEKGLETLVFDNSISQDSVSDILSEGLGDV